MGRRTSFIGIIIILVFSCILMYFVEASQSGYFIKSVWKLGAFVLVPLIYCAFDKNISFKDFFKMDSKKQISISLAMGIGVYALILGGYFAMSGFIDLNNISALLNENARINKDNFVYAALYISFVNSFLEEFFFRGFGFLTLHKIIHPAASYVISALAFSLYHVAILSGWFSPWLFLLIILGLFISGLFFNLLNEKSKNIFHSWLVHMFANFGINTVGFIMFGIL